MNMEQTPKTPNRKKFLLWGAAVISSVTFLKFFTGSKKSTVKKEENNQTVKMLTQDGKLVEIDRSLLANSGKKISNKELQNWIKK